ncbi:MAG: hypothetical protein ABSB35_01835 [Bryobacteraceae bacterium]|jgi:hypothetical protein
MKPLCDLCVQNGVFDSPMTIQGAQGEAQAPDAFYRCLRHPHRSYHQAQGYASVFGKAVPFAPCLCVGHGLPFIESARSASDIVLRCPDCGASGADELPH